MTHRRTGDPSLVSVLMPVKDARPWLEEALASLAAQTDPRWELLAVDDGSQDGSAGVLEAFAGRDPRVRVLRAPVPGGIVAALGVALDASRGSWLARMDADDVCHPDRFEVQRAMLEADPGLSLVSCRVEAFSGDGCVPGGMQAYVDWVNGVVSERQIQHALFVESPFPHPSVMFRREALKAAGGYRDFDGPEDYELWLRMASQGMRFAKSPRVLLRWRDVPGRLSRRSARYQPRAFREVKLPRLVEGPLCGRTSVAVWGAGKVGRWWGRRLASMAVPVDAYLDIDPRKVGRELHGIPVHDASCLPGLHPRPFVLAAVGGWGSREIIRGRLEGMGFAEGTGFLCVE